MHVARGGERVAGRRAGEPEGGLELHALGIRREARAGHADAGGAALAVGDERDVAEPRIDRGRGVLDVGDEGAAADQRAVDEARADAQVLGGLGRHPAAGAEHPVDVRLRDPRVGERVARRLGVQRERRLVRQPAHLVGLADADDGHPAAEPTEAGAHRPSSAGRKCGSAISSDTSAKVTSTRMPMRSLAGSGSTPTRFVIIRGPSSSSTIAST